MADEKIERLITTRKQFKEKIERLNKNPYYKDHFDYIPELDTFKCPKNQYLYYYGKYAEPHKDTNQPR